MSPDPRLNQVERVLRLASLAVEGIQAGVVARGFDDVRPAHGFAFVRIATGDATTVDLAEHLGVTKQAAGQLVAQLVARGYVERVDDPSDGRARLLRLTARGRACTRAAEEAAGDVVAAWAQQLGPSGLAEWDEAQRILAPPGRLRPAW